VKFALDYDGTYTNDPLLWRLFVQNALERGHEVYIVTMRYPSECASIDPWFGRMGVKIIATSRGAKRVITEALGIEIHVWIDDNPEAVHMTAMQIWGRSSPEGQVIDPQHPGASNAA
jgi:hypothetical protein